MANEGMRWMNSQNVRTALEELLDALKRHDAETGYVLDCKQRVKDAETELDKAEKRLADTKAQLTNAQDKLTEEGFLTNESVYGR